MLDKYVVNEQQGEVFSPKYGYHLLILGRNRPKGEDVAFFTSATGFMPITSRDFSEYSGKINDHAINPKYWYLEVGAGLGGFVEHVVANQRLFSPRVIVIDPINYALMQNMLLYARLHLKLDQYYKARIDKIMSRTSLILDETKVRLVNKTLGEAVKDHPELHGVADVVLDHFGPRYHQSTEAASRREEEEDLSKKIIALEKRLLKKTGVLYHHKG